MGYGVDTGYDLGDPRTATLQVVGGGDGTTVAVLTVTRPDATTFTPAVQTTDGGTSWRTTTFYTLSQPEDWVEDWAVTGTGYGHEGRIVRVGTTAAPISLTGVYATAAQYQTFVGAPPANFPRLARMASQDVDDALLTAVYSATDAPTLLALAEACCEQISDYLAKGWLNGTPLPFADIKIGSAQLSGLMGGTSQRAGGASISPGIRLCPRALGVLQRAGLTGQPPNTQASWFWG